MTNIALGVSGEDNLTRIFDREHTLNIQWNTFHKALLCPTTGYDDLSNKTMQFKN